MRSPREWPKGLRFRSETQGDGDDGSPDNGWRG